MKLNPNDFYASTINDLIQELSSDLVLMDFIKSHNLPGGDVLESIASAIIYDDPNTIAIEIDGKLVY